MSVIYLLNTFIMKNLIILATIICFIGSNNVIAQDNFPTLDRPEISSSYLRTNLYAMMSGSPVLADGDLIGFDMIYSNSLDGYDAEKAINMGEGIGMVREGKVLAIERRKLPVDNDSVDYKITGLKTMNYQLEFIASALHEINMRAFLYDKYLNTSQEIDLNGTVVIDFAANKTLPETYQNRFKLVFRENTSLPLLLTNLNLNVVANSVTVSWTINEINGVAKCIVEKSVNGKDYQALGSVSMIANDQHYALTDYATSDVMSYYRIKIELKSGVIKYSPVIAKPATNRYQTTISIMNNPIQNHMLQINLCNQAKGNYTIKLLSNSGAVLMVRSINNAGGTACYNLPIPEMTKGICNVSVQSANATVKTMKIIVL